MLIDEKKKFIEANSDKITQEELDFFKFNFACVYTRNSISIEHGKKLLHLSDIMDIVRGRPVVCDEELKRSVYNHYSAFLDVCNYAKEGVEFTEDLVKNIHSTLTKNTEGVPGGLYRNFDIRISGSNHIPPSHLKVYNRMKEYIEMVNQIEDPIVQAAYAHLQLAKIHPFFDGNGRTSRLVMNFILMKNGFLPVSISVKKRLEYFILIDKYKDDNDAEPFIEFLRNLVDSEYDRMISIITVKTN